MTGKFKMGEYTELIFGARLRKNTPIRVITNLRWLIDDDNTFGPEDMLFIPGRNLLNISSDAFGVNKPVSKIWYDTFYEQHVVCVRSNLKDYDDDIKKFLEWIVPFIDKGSGRRGLYAIVTLEEGDPEFYYLKPEDYFDHDDLY
jgi:hypothetical protein